MLMAFQFCPILERCQKSENSLRGKAIIHGFCASFLRGPISFCNIMGRQVVMAVLGKGDFLEAESR